MTTPVLLSSSRAYPEVAERVFAVLLPLPLPDLFRHRYAAIGRVAAVSGQVGSWGTSGQTRTIHLAGGGTMAETLGEVTPPRAGGGGRFTYTITGITGPLAPLVDGIVGCWRVDPLGTGTRVTWEWALTPSSGPAALAMPLLARMWRGYARLALEELETLVLPTPVP